MVRASIWRPSTAIYRKGKPATKKLRFIAYQDESLRVAALESGDVDISEYIPWQNMAAVEKNPNLTLDTLDGPFLYLVFNMQQGPFTNAKLREAVAYAINRDDIVKAAFFGRGSPLARPSLCQRHALLERSRRQPLEDGS